MAGFEKNIIGQTHSLAELKDLAEKNNALLLYHGGLPADFKKEDIDFNRLGTQQNKKNRTYGGFYLTDDSSFDWSKQYAKQRNTSLHGFLMHPDIKILEISDRDIDRLSREQRDAFAQEYDLLKGKDIMGRTQYVLLTNKAIDLMGVETDKKSNYEKPTITQHPKFQKKNPFDDFLGFIDQHQKRLEASPEQEKQMDQRLKELSELFAENKARWHLDGALNISLMSEGQKYIGVHKDVDVSVELADLAILDKQLLEKDYGLFISHEVKKGEQNFSNLERIDPDTAGKTLDHLTIASIDKNGRLTEGRALNYVDVHLIKRNEKGEPLGVSGTPLPKEWFIPSEVDFKVKKLMMSNPLKVLYYKLQQTRGYDQTDSFALLATNKVSEDGLAELAKVIKGECDFRLQRANSFIADVLPKIKLGMTVEQVFASIASHPLLADKIDSVKDQLLQASEEIANDPSHTEPEIKKTFLKIFKVEDRNNEILEKLKQLETHFEENKKIAAIRQKIK